MHRHTAMCKHLCTHIHSMCSCTHMNAGALAGVYMKTHIHKYAHVYTMCFTCSHMSIGTHLHWYTGIHTYKQASLDRYKPMQAHHESPYLHATISRCSRHTRHTHPHAWGKATPCSQRDLSWNPSLALPLTCSRTMGMCNFSEAGFLSTKVGNQGACWLVRMKGAEE